MNTAKVTYDAQAAVTLNTAKVTYDAQAAVTLNTAKVTYNAQAAVALNTAKVTYDDSALVASHTVSIASNATAVGLRATAATPSFTGVVSFDNNTIDNSTSNRFKVNAQVFELGTGGVETTLESKGSYPIIIRSGMPSSGTIEISGSSNGDINFYPHGTGRVKINKGVTFSGLPTSDPGVAGQLWNDSGALKISS